MRLWAALVMVACEHARPAPPSPVAPAPQDNWVHTVDASEANPPLDVPVGKLASAIEQDVSPYLYERVVLMDERTGDLVALCGDASHGLAVSIQPLLRNVMCTTRHDARIQGDYCTDLGDPKVSLILRERDSALHLVAVIIFEHVSARDRYEAMWKLVDDTSCP